MPNNKPSFGSKIKRTIFSNFGIKFLALVISVVVFVIVRFVA